MISGAAVVVHVLLLCSTTANVNALPPQTTATSNKDERIVTPRYSRQNGTTWTARGRTRNLDVALNELNSKDSVSEEQTDAKNSKYKDRGRVKFLSSVQPTTNTPVPRRVRTSTTGPKFTIVTPTPAKKNITQILDSMREYKKTKVPVIVLSTTPMTVEEKLHESVEVDDNEDDEFDEEDVYKDKYSYEENKGNTFHETDSFFTIPGFSDSDDDFVHDSEKADTVSKGYSVPSYNKFTSYFPKEDSFSSPSESYNSDSFFHDFDFQLTTPRNDYFDKKFKDISNSIMSNLASIRAQVPVENKTNNPNIVKQNLDVEKRLKGIPTNKSTVIIKNTKEIRLLDNEEAGTDKKELSDVQGTSIYYEMSVLSTETYAIEQSNEDDCDNDTLSFEPTPSTTSDEEISSIKSSHQNLILFPAKDILSTSAVVSKIPQRSSSTSTTSSSTTTTTSIPITIVETTTPQVITITTTERPMPKTFSSSYRNRNYSKRISFSSNRDYPNSVTAKTDQVTSNQVYKPVTRRIQYTTPKVKPIWMAPRRNFTRNSYTKTTYPTTIYAEHFSTKDNINSTSKSKNKTSTLTTVSSDIDPIIQSEVGTSKKVVHSQTISDNSIPQLRKRGSMKFASTTVSSTQTETESDIMEIPPTLTAWALAGLRSPPSVASSTMNLTRSNQKTIDEEDLQNVADISGKISVKYLNMYLIVTNAHIHHVTCLNKG